MLLHACYAMFLHWGSYNYWCSLWSCFNLINYLWFIICRAVVFTILGVPYSRVFPILGVFNYSRFFLFSFIHILGFSIFGWSYSQCFIFSVFSCSRYISLPSLVPITGVSVSYSRLIFIELWSLLYWPLWLFFACVILYEVVIWLGEFKYGMYM